MNSNLRGFSFSFQKSLRSCAIWTKVALALEDLMGLVRYLACSISSLVKISQANKFANRPIAL